MITEKVRQRGCRTLAKDHKAHKEGRCRISEKKPEASPTFAGSGLFQVVVFLGELFGCWLAMQ